MIKFWIPETEIRNIFNLELVVVCFLVFACSYIFYRLFLVKISEKRHKNLKARFRQLPVYFLILVVLLSADMFLEIGPPTGENLVVRKLLGYSLLLGLLLSTVVLIKIFQILVYCYLFFMNMSLGIPRLLANVGTFFFSIVLVGFMCSYIFNINLAALATTSAVFSIILGLALQDTIGNLFAGLSLQIDRSLKIGDWVEINTGADSWAGQIQEITWRSTYLQGFSNEIYMVPNRTMASAKVIFQVQENKSRRLTHTLRFSYNENFEVVSDLLGKALQSVPLICKTPEVRVLLLETQESWIRVGVFYTIEDYSLKYRIGDQAIKAMLSAMQAHHIAVQCPSVEWHALQV